jgi:hypothetical protein
MAVSKNTSKAVKTLQNYAFQSHERHVLWLKGVLETSPRLINNKHFLRELQKARQVQGALLLLDPKRVPGWWALSLNLALAKAHATNKGQSMHANDQHTLLGRYMGSRPWDTRAKGKPAASPRGKGRRARSPA